jgi:ribonuclease HI
MRSWRLHNLILKQWGELTGETKLKQSDGRVALLGDRTGTWLDEAEQAEFAGLETPFAIVHKTTLHVIKEERDKDVARRTPSSKYTRRTAAQLYQRVASTVERIMVDRWWRAHAQRHNDGGKAMLRFRKQWEAPGLVAIPLEGGAPKLLLFLHDTTRARYKRKGDSLRSRHFRNQAYAPPMNLPDGTVSIFTDGSALPRKPGNMFPPAGFGFAAVTGGNGHEHTGGREIACKCGPVDPSTPNVKTATNNSSELVAFTRALQWARSSHLTKSRAIVIRFDSAYASMIASGSWKAKKHKDLAAEARAAWTDLRKHTNNNLWLRHVRGHSGHAWNDRADHLASQGRQGQSIYHELATL